MPPIASVRRALQGVVAVLALAGAAQAASPYDGVYKGGNTLAGGGGTRCPPPVQWNVVVKDGTFQWKLGNESETVRVAADGSFTGQSGMRFINGRIVDRTLTAATSGSACNYTWSHTR